ncbi:MAG: GNAT family N-acetyltransferase [Saccharospirillaceae bacterium]|nr:GNAT family N-acetyltransferase [Saccharospirillaceae bacterium]
MDTFENLSKQVLLDLKSGVLNLIINTDIEDIYLEVVTEKNLNINSDIELFSNWRGVSEHAFLKIFPITNEGTKKWLQFGVLEREDRILFFILNKNKERLGHIGLSSFDFEKRTCEIDNVIKSPTCKIKGLFDSVTNALIKWTFDTLSPSSIKLRVFSDNTKAIALYHRVGFVPVDLVMFKKIENDHSIEWVESENNIDRCFLVMEKVKVDK